MTALIVFLIAGAIANAIAFARFVSRRDRFSAAFVRRIARDEFARIERERADAQRESVAADLKTMGERAR